VLPATVLPARVLLAHCPKGTSNGSNVVLNHAGGTLVVGPENEKRGMGRDPLSDTALGRLALLASRAAGTFQGLTNGKGW